MLHRFLVVAALAGGLLVSASAGAVADGTPLTVVSRKSVFGSSIGVGNTLMEHDGRVNFAVRVEGSQATIPLSDVPADATVVQAFLFWGGTFDTDQGINLDRTADLILPNGTLLNDLSVDTLRPGEPAPTTTNRCVQRNHPVGGDVVQMFSCRREITGLLANLGPGGAVGTYELSDVNLSAGDCNVEPATCEAKFGGWAVVVMWESPTEPVKRDLVLSDGFFALDEQGGQFGGFSSGISPEFAIDGLVVGDDESGELTFLSWEGDAQLGVPPQNLAGNPFRCNDGRCEDFVDVHSNTSNTRVRLVDATNRSGNVMNGSNNKSGGSHPGLDIDTFDIGRTGLRVIRTGDTRLLLRAGSGDGVADDTSGGSGELFLMGFTLVSVDTFSPRFLNSGTEKVVLEPVAGPGETLNYILRLENDGSAPATNTIVKDQLPAGAQYAPNSTVNTCGVASTDVGGTSPVLTAAGLNVATLTIGERCEVRFRAIIRDTVNEGDQLRNFFTVQADGVPPLSVGPAITIVENAELSRPTKSVVVVGGGEPAPGATLNYRFRVENDGSRPAPDVSIVDDFPATLEALTVVSAPAGAVVTFTGNHMDVQNVDIAAGSFADVVVSARIVAGTATGTVITNQAEVDQPSLTEPLLTDDPAVNNTTADPTSIRVTAGIDLASSTKTATDVNGGRLVPGDVVEFRVRVDKRGPAATVVTLDDDLPQNVGGCVVVAPVPPGTSASCQPGGANGTGRFTALMAFGAPGVATFTFRVTVNAAAPDGATIANTATLVPLADPSLTVNVSSAPLVVFARPDLQIVKSVVDVNGGADVRPGELLRYSMVLTNPGTVAANNVVITDAVDANLVSIVGLDGGVVTGQNVRWTIPSLAVGATATVRFEARVKAGVVDGTVIANRAAGDADDPQQPVNSNTVNVTVRAAPILAVTKTVADRNAAPFRPGDVVGYTIVVRNTGDGVARDVVVRDVLDANFAAPILTSGGRVVAGAVVFDDTTVAALDSIAIGGSVTLTFDARLNAVIANGTSVPNQAQTTTPSLPATTVQSDDPATAAPADPTRFTVTSQAVIAIKKTFVDDNGGALLPGETVTFTLAVDASGDAPANSVLVEDPLDARLTFVSSADGGAVTAGRVRFPTFNLLPGATRLLRFVARVATPLADGTTIDNQAQGSSPTTVSVVSDDPNTAAALDPTRLLITSRPVFDTSTKAVLDVDGDGVFRPRGRVRYTIVVSNTGSENGAGVVVKDTLPAQLTNIAAAGATVTGQLVTFNIGALNVGASRTVTIDADIVRPLADNVVVSNQAIISATGQPDVVTDDPATATPDDPTRFTVTSKPHLIVQKTVVDGNGAPAEPGDSLTWTITLRNDGDRDADNVSVTDVVDANLQTIVPLDGGVLNAGTITWTLARIALDATSTVRFTSVIKTPLNNGTLISNQARAALAEPGVPGAPFPSDNPATAAPLDPTTVQVVSAADLSTSTLESFSIIGAGAAIAVAAPGDTVEYRLAVQNRGRANGDNVVVTLPFPAGFVVVDAVGGVVAGTTITFNIGTVAPGAVIERRPRLRLPTPVDDNTTFDVQGSLAGTGIVTPFVTDDPSTATLSDPTRLTIDSAPIFSVQKTFVDDDAATDGGAVEPGDTVTYRLSLTNTGNAVARDVVVEDAFPAQTLHVSGGRLAGGSVFFDRNNTAALANVAPGAPPIVLTFVVRVKPDTASGVVVNNQARTSGSGVLNSLSDDPTTAAPLDPTRFVVTALPKLTMSKTVDGPVRVFAPGDTVAYSITLTSSGTAAAGGAFSDVVDAGFATVAPGAGLAFNAATRTLTATIAPLAPGASRTLTFSAVVGAGVTNGTLIANQARVTDVVLGTVLSDDPTTTTALDPTLITINANADLSTTTKTVVDVNGAPLKTGDTLRYTISIINSGTGAAADVRVVDAIDPELLQVSDSGGGTSVGTTLVWDRTLIPALAAIGRGQRVDLTFTATVIATVDGTVIDNQASVVSRDVTGTVLSDDPATAAVDDPTRVIVQAPLLVITKSVPDAAFFPGADVAYTLVIENRGSIDATGVEVKDVLPPALTSPAIAGGSVANGTATVVVGTFAAGATRTIDLSGTIDVFAVGGSAVSNQAEVRSNETGVVVSDDPSTPAPNDPTVRLVDANEVYTGSVELFDGETGAAITAPVDTGARVRARITVTNSGTQTGRAVVVTAPFNPTQFVPDEATEGGLVDDDGDVRWTASQLPALTNFAPGQTVVLELEGRVGSPLANGTEIPFEGDVTSVSSTTPTIIGPAILRVRARPNLSASTKEVVDVDGGLVEPGDILQWRITVLNDGGAEASDVVVEDAIPAGMRYLPGTTRLAAVAVDDAGGVPVQHLAIGDVVSGRAVVLEFSTRVDLNAPRGVTLSNQAVLRATGTADARTDDPRTPLVVGDATSVVVGGGPLLVMSKTASTNVAHVGQELTFAIHVENGGTDAATDLVIDDVLDAAVSYVAGSLEVDGVRVSDANDNDAGSVDGATIRLRNDRLEAGDGFALTFRVVPNDGATVVVNQARLSSSEGALLSDGDPGTPGVQPTVLPVEGNNGLLFDEKTLRLEDENGGLLLPGDRVILRASLRNRGLGDARVTEMTFPIPDGLDVVAAELDGRFVADAAVVRLADNAIDVEAGAGSDVSVVFVVEDAAERGDVVTATGSALVRNDADALTVDLGEDSLTVGLLPGTASLSGTLFVESGERDGVVGDGDVKARGFTVQAFWRDEENPVQSVVTDDKGRFRLTPIPSGRTRLVVLGPSGARFADVDIGPLEDGEVREQDVAFEPSGSVYVSNDGRAARGARVVLFVDDGDDDVDNDRRVDPSLLKPGQQEQPVSPQGFYRFDAPRGRYRIGIVSDDPLLTFPSSKNPVSRDDSRHPLGRQATAGDISDIALPDDKDPPQWVARFVVGDDGAGILRNHVPLDPLKNQVEVTKTASRKRASIGEIVTYEVRVENKALQRFDLDSTGGVEIVDTLPAGFQLVDGSFQLARLSVDGKGQQKRTLESNLKVKGARTLVFGPTALEPGTTLQLRYNVVIGPGAAQGQQENTAALRLAEGSVPVSDAASAVVQVVADDTFDVGSVRAKVYCDDDGDGWQDVNERGVWGARVYLDNGHYADADVTGKLHFSGVEPGMHLAKLDERTLPGVTMTTPRQSFYLSAGLPSQVAFAVRCVADVPIAATEFDVNEIAYRPEEKAPKKVLVEGALAPARVVVDGAVLLIPQVALDLSARGKEPVLPGPNLDDANAPLELRPRVQSPAPVAAWQIVIEDVATSTTTTTAAPTAVTATGFEDVMKKKTPEAPQPTTSTTMTPTSATPVYVFAGKGLPPDRIVWAGRDDSGKAILVDGHVYRAVLTVGVEGGDRVSTAPHHFGVAVAADGSQQESKVIGVIDESDGALFLKSGKASKRLQGFLAGHVESVKKAGAAIEVRAHLDAVADVPAAALTAQRADAAVKALVEAGADASKLKAVARGDEEPLFPNGREKDRKKNRRIELVVAASKRVVPPLPALPESLSTSTPASVMVAGAPVAPDENGTWKTTLEGPVVLVDVVFADGARLRLARDSVTPQPPTDAERSALAPLPVSLSPTTRSLTVDGNAARGLGLLDVRVEPRLAEKAVLVSIPKDIEVRKTTVRVLMEKEGAPAFSNDDADIGAVVKDVVVEGRADRVEFADDYKSGVVLRFRAIVEDGEGNVGVSPDVRAVVGAAAATTTTPKTTAPALTTLADPGDGTGAAPSDEAKKATIALAKTIAPGSKVHIEVHTDDRGPRLERGARTQQLAEALQKLLVDNGVAAADVTALGKGSDSPLVPNTGSRNKKKNRRADITVEPPAPAPTTTTTTDPAAPVETPVPVVKVNGKELVANADGAYAGDVAPLDNGELSFEVKDASNARAFVKIRKNSGEMFSGAPEAFRAAHTPTATATPTPTTETTPSTEPTTAVVDPADVVPHKDGAAPSWWPTKKQLPASSLSVALPQGQLGTDTIAVRGTAAPESRVTVNGVETRVDPIDGSFGALVKLPRGPSVVVVEAVDALGNKARAKADVNVDTDGWFALLLADTAVGGDGALLDERNAYTSATLGPAFVYGRGAAYVKGNFHGPWLFSDYGLTLHLDTRRWNDDVFARDVFDPERGFPAWGDSSLEVQEAKSGIPLYLELSADNSSLSVGSVRTDLQNGELFRYQRARTGAQLRFDRGWLDPVDVTTRKTGEKPAPETDPWRTQATTFLAGGGGERHARVELMGTGGSVYFLRHERIVEGSERVAVIVRDGVTGAEIARETKVRNVDYTIRYAEGRLLTKEPIGAFADAAFVTNHNLGQVASGHRVFVEVEYEHQDDTAFQGLASGVDVKQTLYGNAEVGAAYVIEGREGGEVGYQLGGVSAKLFLDPANRDSTYIAAQLLGSQSVDAGNFVSFDGGLTYDGLGQGLDEKDARLGSEIFPKERSGLGFKLDGAARFGRYVGRADDDGVARAYFQALQPGFFGGGGSIVEQGQTKWGLDSGYRVTPVDELRLRYDGVVSEIPEREPITQYRVLHRELVTGRYARTLMPGLVGAGEVGYGFTGDSGSFDGNSDPVDDVHTVVTAAGVEYQVLEALQLGLKQEVIVLGDPNQLKEWNDHFVTHFTARYAITDALSVDGGISLRWSGENQVHAGVGYKLNEGSRVYASERFGVLPAPGTGTMGWSTTTVVGAESEVAKGSKAYGEYQLQSAFGGDQTRGVVGLANNWALPFGFALSLNYERVTTLGGAVPTTENGNVPPGAFTDGTFYAAPGANGGGSFLYGNGTRDAVSTGVEWKRDDLFVGSERFELRYDNFAEDRGGNDTLWFLSMTAVAVKLTPELSLLSRYNLALAQDLATGNRAAYVEEGSFGVAFRPITHDWFSALAKVSRKVDVRPLSLEAGVVDDTAIHAASLEPIVELPWKLQLVEKLALKHMSVQLDDVPKADALTMLWINRVNWHALGTLRGLGIDPVVPGEIDLGVEYRMLAGLSYNALEHGALLEMQYAPLDYFRIGVGWNFTRFSDNELDAGDVDHSGFFVRAVGTY